MRLDARRGGKRVGVGGVTMRDTTCEEPNN